MAVKTYKFKYQPDFNSETDYPNLRKILSLMKQLKLVYMNIPVI